MRKNPPAQATSGGAPGAPGPAATAAPPVGGAALAALFDRLAAPFDPAEVRSRRGPRGDLRYITARTARRRLNDVLGPDNWSCRIEPAERWVRCALTITLPDGREITREALGGYPNMPDEEDRVKGGDSDAFKRACVLFGIGEYLYGDDPAEPAPPPPTSHRPGRAAEPAPPPPTSNGNGRGEPRNVPRDRISFPDARAFFGFCKDGGHLGLADEIGKREGYPRLIIHWTPEQIDLATEEILQATGGGR